MAEILKMFPFRLFPPTLVVYSVSYKAGSTDSNKVLAGRKPEAMHLLTNL